MKKIILSGMRPTGKLHLGHLIGVLGNWKKLQEQYECFFMAADWHALMSEYEEPADIRENLIDMVVDWLACGIDINKAKVFIQSQVKEHLELYMIFSVIVPLGWLQRCPTYKEQLREAASRDLSTYGFLGYPVLQAADILLYKAELVPVGQDQLPHLELTREIARKFNSLYKRAVFPGTQALLSEYNKLPGLDGRKMSKSYDNYIAISEPAASLRQKVSSMFTDPKRIKLSDPGHPDECNVHRYYEIFSPVRKDEIADGCKKSSIGCTECKSMLAGILIDFLKPIQEKRNSLLKDKDKILDALEEGREKAHNAAAATMEEVRTSIHF